MNTIKITLKTLFLSTILFIFCNGQSQKSKISLGQHNSVSKETDSIKDQVKSDLKYNHIRSAALQEKAGNLWFGTSGNGLFRYDGKTTTHFTMDKSLSNEKYFIIDTNIKEIILNGLCANNVQALYEDSKGRIWISSGTCVCYYNGINFIQVNIFGADITPFGNSATQNKHASIWSILEDKNGNMWFTAFDAGVYKYDGKTVTHFQIGELMQGIAIDKEGNIWFNFIRYDGKTFTNMSPWGGESGWVLRTLKDKKGNLWFSQKRSGLYCYNGKTFTHYTMKDGLGDDYSEPEFIFEDKSGKIWAGGNGFEMGNDDLFLCYFDGKSFHRLKNILNSKKLKHNDSRPILGDKEGNIWISAGGLLFRYDGKTLSDFTNKIFD